MIERILPLAITLMLLTCLLPPMAQAKKSDRSATIKVTSDSFDSQGKPNGITHLKGHVVITQGTFKATSDLAIVHFDADSNVSRVILKGKPAHFRQIDDNGNLIKGHALTVDYNIPKGVATLTGNAYIEQAGRGTASGNTLVYNTTTSTMTAHSKGDNRVHLTFKPRQEASAPASTTTAPAPAASTGGN